MCGIVAYVGKQEACPVIVKGLKRLEYRGYDSSGIALLQPELTVYKKKGRISELESILESATVHSTIGIGHTRWATHGEPSDYNAHPHLSGDGKLAIVHNGIIENYAQLKKELVQAGHVFKSDTDTEVLVHFIEEIKYKNSCSTEEALQIALKRVVGAYVIVIIDQDLPDTLIAARKGSPLVIGVGKNEHILASDASPIIEYTKDVIYVNDYEIAIVRSEELVLKNSSNEVQTPYIQKLDMDLASIEKGGFEHFMLKEIYEQPSTVFDCMRGRLDAAGSKITLGGLSECMKELVNARRIVFVACGTSWHAGLVAEYLIEELCRIPVEVEYASEFRYRNPVLSSDDVVIAISQSGETADTIVALEQAKEKGVTVLGICNVVGSSIARLTHAGVYTHAGHEIGVASTKAFTAQLTVLYLLALKLADAKGTISKARFNLLSNELSLIPEKIKQILENVESVKNIAEKYAACSDFLYLGRGINFPIALEGALKMKEVSYIHAEGYPAAEMKHGPIALVDENLPVLFIATRDKCYDKIISNIQEIKSRKGKVIAVVSEEDEVLMSLADDSIKVPFCDELLSPIINCIPLQLLSYFTGVSKEYDVDKPRNLAKSVTVE